MPSTADYYSVLFPNKPCSVTYNMPEPCCMLHGRCDNKGTHHTQPLQCRFTMLLLRLGRWENRNAEGLADVPWAQSQTYRLRNPRSEKHSTSKMYILHATLVKIVKLNSVNHHFLKRRSVCSKGLACTFPHFSSITEFLEEFCKDHKACTTYL